MRFQIVLDIEPDVMQDTRLTEESIHATVLNAAETLLPIPRLMVQMSEQRKTLREGGGVPVRDNLTGTLIGRLSVIVTH